jgi:hypothetical protein
MSLVMPRGHQMSLLIAPERQVASTKESQMREAGQGYAVIISFSAAGVASQVFTSSLKLGDVNQTADQIVHRINEASAKCYA